MSRAMHLRIRGALLTCAALLGFAGAPHAAWADCWFTQGAVTTVTFNAGTITITPNTQPGTVLWTSNTASPANPPELRCSGATGSGIVNSLAGPPAGGDATLFPTGIPGIAYRILHPDTSLELPVYPNDVIGSGNYSFSIASNLQLVYVGPFLPPDDSALTGELARWKVDICEHPSLRWGYYYRRCNGPIGPHPVEIFNINAVIHLLVPSCEIDAGSVNTTVTLPPTAKAAFAGQSSTTGATPFALHLTQCPSGLGVFITLDTASPVAGASGVIASASGGAYASGVGVQLLRADGTTPVTFATPLNTGVATASQYAIHLYARYYQTGATVTPGNVKAIATYTVQYQ